MRWFIHDHKITPLGRPLDTIFCYTLSPDIIPISDNQIS